MNTQLGRIFCIDDEDDILQVLQLSLETVGGFDVTCCNDPVEAVEKVADADPDLIILDVMMPGMDGPTTLSALRRKPELQRIPIVFMTARAQQEDIDSYIALGAAGVITKPFDPMTVSEQVEKLWTGTGHG